MPRICGGIAQLGERLHGMQEVIGSIPISSTTHVTKKAPKGAFFVLDQGQVNWLP